jgi:hypothetical protein
VFAQYLCDQWRDERGIEIHTIEMWATGEAVTIETIDDPAGRVVTRERLFRYGCNGVEPHVLDLPGIPGPDELDPEATPAPGEET